MSLNVFVSTALFFTSRAYIAVKYMILLGKQASKASASLSLDGYTVNKRPPGYRPIEY
jgi:hypothetical protein